MLGTAGLSQEDLKESGPDVNYLALATANISWNAKASAVQNRISTIVFHSGVKCDDLVCLNCLGVCTLYVSRCHCDHVKENE